MTIAVGLLVSRFVHYLSLSILCGGALFPFYGFATPQPDAYARLPWLRPLLLGAASFTLLSGLSWFACATAGVNAQLSNAAIIRDADFGTLWAFRLLLAAGLVVLLLGRQASPRRFQLVLAGALILLATIALTGNAGANESSSGFRHRLADAVHLAASGVWIGALVVFARLVMSSVRNLRDEDLGPVHHALAQFSGVGTLAVAGLTLSGMINPGFFQSRLDTGYGQLLLAKLGIFGAMLALASANRFWLTPRLSRALEARDDWRRAIVALRVSIVLETALGILVLALVAWLGVLAPPDFTGP
jgi:copper resistance protein D